MAENNIQIDLELVTKAFESSLKEAEKQVDSFGDNIQGIEKTSAKSLENVGKTGKKAGEDVAEGGKQASTAWEVFKGVLGAEVFIGAFNAVAGAAKGLFNTFIVDGVKGAQEAQASLIKLQSVLASTGDGSQATLQDFKEFASGLQATTKADGDAVLSQIALAKQYGLTNAQAKQVVITAQDMAARGYDADTSVRQLSETFSGQAGRLGKLNPALKDLTEAQLKAGAGAQILATQFAGSAANAVDTFAGRLTQAENNFGDVQEAIGDLIIQNPAIIAALADVGKLFQQVTEYVAANSKEITAFVSGALTSLIDTVKSVVSAGVAFNTFITENEALIKTLGVAIAGTAIAFGTYALAVNASAIATSVAATATAAFSAALAVTPVGLAVIAVGALSAGVYALATNWDFVTAKMGEFAASAFTLIAPAITTILDTLRPLVSIFSDELTESIDAAKETITEQSDELLALQGEAEANSLLQKETALAQKQAAEDLALSNQINANATTNATISAGKQQAAATDLATLTSKLTAEAAAEKEATKAKSDADKKNKDEQIKKEKDFQALALSEKKKAAADYEKLERESLERQEASIEANRIKRYNAEQSITGAVFAEGRKRNSFEEANDREKVANFTSTLGSISSLQSSSNKEMFEVGKAAAIAQATISTFQAASIALASAPPPFNYALAAAVTVAGLLNVQKISQTTAGSYADGGIIPGASFAGDRLQANVNSGEMVLNRTQQQRLFSMANGDGGGGSSAIMDKLDSLTAAILGQPVVVEIDGESIATAVRSQVRGGFSLGGT